MTEPNIIKVLIIKPISKHRYDLVAEVLRRNKGSVIELGGNRYCTGMSTGVEVFDIDCFTEYQLATILEGK